MRSKRERARRRARWSRGHGQSQRARSDIKQTSLLQAKRQQLLADYELQRIRNEELNQSLGKLSDANPAVFKKRSQS